MIEITKIGSNDSDRTYDITVQLSVSGTATPGVDYDLHYVSYDANGKPVLGSKISMANGAAVVKISANPNKIPGGDTVTIAVVPIADFTYEDDETVCLTIIDAYAEYGYSFNYSGYGSVTILQAPEFISDADENVDTSVLPFAINDDYYQAFLRRDAGTGVEIVTLNPVFAESHSAVEYSITDGNELNLFEIDSVTGIITTTTSLVGLANLPDSFCLTVVAVRHDPVNGDGCFPPHKGGKTIGTVTILAAEVDLDTDSDNNGYINKVNTPENGFRRDAEDAMEESTAKPITYFPDETDVPEDYMYVPLRVGFKVSGLGVKYSFHYTPNIKVYKKTVENGTENYEEVPSNYKWSIADQNNLLLAGEGNYYVKAVAKGEPDPNTPSGFDKVHLVLWDANNQEIARDTVSFQVEQTLAGWIVASGWRIDGDTLTTMTPTDCAVGPKQEGGYYGNNDKQKRGATFSKGTYANGFVLEFDYSFVRNGENGYLQPDTNENEVIDSLDGKKVSFVGNSGIKLGGYQGTDDGITEVAILDMWALVELVGGIDEFKARIDNSSGMVNLSKINGINYASEHISQLMNGVVYKDLVAIKDNIAGAAGKSYQDLFVENYNLFSGGGGGMKVEYSATGTLSVYVMQNGAYVKYYEKTGVTITGDDKDGKVYIQSHWGSGVTFSRLKFL